ncbi:MAG: sugar transferase [Planctomycetes bacterium]|nr:sugar transferase [Planctomycetota bacterium]
MPSSLRHRRRARLFVELEARRDDAPELSATLPHAASDVLDESVDWERLAPRGTWATTLRPLLDELLLALCIVPAALIGAGVAVASAIAFGSLRKVLFVQPRVGHRGRIFNLVKFRTMRDAPQGNFAAWSAGDQARVTSFGRFLRSSHLDELPQLINVLRGEMSFIGPRPEMVEVEEWANANVPGFIERLAIKPGITGLAQVTQGYTPRDVQAYQRKLELNRAYLRNMSCSTDLAVLVRTFFWMARGRGWRWDKSAAPKH